MAASEPNLVDWLTLGAASIGTILTAGIGVWSVTRRDREVFDTAIEWEWSGYGPNPEMPFVYVQNRSAHTLSIIDLVWATGVFRATPEKGTAVYHEDPGDLSFPYQVKSGETIKIYLSEDGAKRAFEKIRPRVENWSWLRKSVLWLGLTTIRGTYRLIPGEKALPWSFRPDWMTGEKSNA